MMRPASRVTRGKALLNTDSKLERLLAQHLDRVLIVDHTPAAARMLADLIQNIHRGEIMPANSTALGLSLAQTRDPQIIFTEYAGPEIDGVAFTKALRRSSFSCRKVPVIMVTGQATPAAILGARDSGVHEFLRKPYNNADLVRRLEAALLKPRGWVEGVGYLGPDRRRFNSAEFKGSRKRRSDSAESKEEAAALQALRIVVSAMGAIETDPKQAYRALCTQAVDLQRAAARIGNESLYAAAVELQHQLNAIGSPGRINRAELEPFARRLLTFLPKNQDQAARPAA
jgi:response regulator RpfG family c-di-GMP phosphodiesterase